jgi:elongation factor Ts
MKIKSDQVRELREKSKAGMMDCKKALVEANGDIEKAAEILREKGLAKALKKASRETKEGIIESYIHQGSKIGVLLEVDCETDFVARNELFRSFVHDLALHIAASGPLYISIEDVPEEEVEKEKEVYKKQAANEGKPENIAKKIAEGRINKYFEENVLLEQAYIRDPDKKINDLLKEKIATIGENIVIKRFCRYVLGEYN